MHTECVGIVQVTRRYSLECGFLFIFYEQLSIIFKNKGRNGTFTDNDKPSLCFTIHWININNIDIRPYPLKSDYKNISFLVLADVELNKFGKYNIKLLLHSTNICVVKCYHENIFSGIRVIWTKALSLNKCSI